MVTEPLAAAPAGVDSAAWSRACAAVRAYCGWHVAPSVTESITLDGSGTQFLMLPSLRVTDITAITEDGSTADATQYQWSATGQLWRSWPWSGNFRSVVVDLTHGYDSCPEEILGVLEEAASRGTAGTAVSQVGQVRMGGVAGVPGAVSFLMEQKAVLDRYRIGNRP